MRGKPYSETQMIDIIMAHKAGDSVGLYAMIFTGTWIPAVGKVYIRSGRKRLLTGKASDHVTQPCHLSGYSC